MEGQNYIGIYLSKDSATVVCLGTAGKEYRVLGCFGVSVQAEESESGSEKRQLAGLIAEKLGEIVPTYRDCEIAVALDCSMFMQHSVHSAFRDIKQITQTIKFDTEEAIAADVSDLGISFKISSSDEQGSDLIVFTAQRKILSEIILSLQGCGIDPVSIEPDVHCISRFIGERMPTIAAEEGAVLYALLSGRNGYFTVLSSSNEQYAARTFLIGPKQDRDRLLAREIPITLASAKTSESINMIRLLDSTRTIDCQQLGAKHALEAELLDMTRLAEAEPQTLSDCGDEVNFAIAYGAALSHLEKAKNINFRSDFMPYMGKKMRMQKTLKILSVSVIIVMIALGSYFQLELMRQNKYRARLREKFGQDYSIVMAGKKLPKTNREAVNRLGSELRRIRDVKSGQLSITGEESVSVKLALVLEAFNKCAAQTGLSVESISITAKNIVITGETSGRRNTLRFFDAIKENKLEILQQSLDSKSGRDNFRITVEPRK